MTDCRSVPLLSYSILLISDLALTVENMMSATEGVDVPESCNAYFDTPFARFEYIVRRSGKRGLFSDFLSNHPYPRWEMLVKLLEQLEKWGKARAGLAEEVKAKYLTSE